MNMYMYNALLLCVVLESVESSICADATPKLFFVFSLCRTKMACQSELATLSAAVSYLHRFTYKFMRFGK